MGARADQARYDAAIELLRARDSLREAYRHGFGTEAHKQRVEAAEKAWDRLQPKGQVAA